MRLLIVGTLEGHIVEAGKIAQARGVRVINVDDGARAIAFLREGGADIVFADVRLDIAALIHNLSQERIVVPVIACGIGNETQLAVRAIKAGAKEYLPLPPDPEIIAAVLETVSDVESTIIYKDPVMAKVVALADQIAASEASVFITGESGTGKEIMARYLHKKSRRRDRPFISVNCAAIPDNLLESELFGHEKGAFTGAVARRIGKFEEADGGTLLLDEISEMHPRLQAKLLRAIQEREIDRVGGTKPIKVNIRLLATSNRDMEAAIHHGNFREDLYFRLNVVSLRLPALRERPLDIPLLANFFLKKYAHLNGLDEKPMSDSLPRYLQSYEWKGNVRELENAMHRAILLSTCSSITEEDIELPKSSHQVYNSREESFLGKTVAEAERDLILDTLNYCSGNRTHAATILGISIRTLRNKLKQYREEGLNVSDNHLDQAC